MEKLFAAIQAKHPGCQIMDVQFLVNRLELDPRGHDVNALDEDLAYAVENAGEPITEPPNAKARRD